MKHAPDRTLRLFFALVPAASVREAIAERGRDIATRAAGRVVPKANLHLTLAFLGNVSRALAPPLARILDEVPGTGFDLRLDRMGVFRQARVAWIAPAIAPESLAVLERCLRSRLQETGFPPDARPFRPHVTLARHCATFVAEAACAPIGWRVDHVALVESRSAGDGIRYRDLASRALEAR